MIDPELVSSVLSSVIPAAACSTQRHHRGSLTGRNVVVYAWYDNEFGYTKQVIPPGPTSAPDSPRSPPIYYEQLHAT